MQDVKQIMCTVFDRICLCTFILLLKSEITHPNMKTPLAPQLPFTVHSNKIIFTVKIKIKLLFVNDKRSPPVTNGYSAYF